MKLKGSNPVLVGRNAEVVAFVLALCATGVSLALATSAGWQRGGGVMGALVGALAVLGAHFLLALMRSFQPLMRLVAGMVWLICLAMVMYGHAGAFLLQVQQAGMHRATSVQFPSDIDKPERNLPMVLSEQAKVQTELARVRATLAGIAADDCSGRCINLRGRLAALSGRLAALEAEADLIQRWVAAHDEMAERQKSEQTDPVARAMQAWLGVTAERTNLAAAVGYAVTLEGLACLGWLLVIAKRDSSIVEPVTQGGVDSVTARVTQSQAQQDITKTGPTTSPPDELGIIVTHLLPVVRNGALRPTVNAVMEHLSCSRTKAAEVARQLKARLQESTQPV